MLISNFLRQHSGVEEVINAGWRIKWEDNEDETQISQVGGNGGTFHQKYLCLQVNELEKKLDLMLKEQVSAYLSMHKNVGEKRDCQGKFKALGTKEVTKKSCNLL